MVLPASCVLCPVRVRVTGFVYWEIYAITKDADLEDSVKAEGGDGKKTPAAAAAGDRKAAGKGKTS